MAELEEILAFLRLDGTFAPAAEAVEAKFGGTAKWAAARDGATEKYRGETRLVQSYAPQPDPYGATSMPIYQSATFAMASADCEGDYDYTRSGNPTRTAFERAVADAEGCARALSYSTGMAALTAVTRLATAGSEILLSDDSYGGTYRLVSKLCAANGVSTRYLAMDGPDGPKRLEAAITEKTALVMVESPTNPMQRVCDLRGLARVCRAKGVIMEVDNTLMSPLLQKPLDLGAHIVVHSATKFFGGHSDTMAGVVCVNDAELLAKLAHNVNAEGTALAPFDCWLMLRGMKTMGLRVHAAQRSAVAIAHFLEAHGRVKKVFYATLATNPDRALHASQATGGGCVVCFTTGSVALSKHVVTATKLFRITVSFGTVNSLISCPCDMSHASIPAEVRAARDFPEDIIRVCVGVEHVNDLIADLAQALDSYKP